MTIKLNYKIQGSGKPIIFLHGVLGSLDNLNILAKAFINNYQIIQVDLRNHGLSPWSDEMTYQAMANDVMELCQALKLDDIILIGHSMGGKVAMQLTQLMPEKIYKMVVLDIAPVHYLDESNSDILNALYECLRLNLTDRKAIIELLELNNFSQATIQFLLKSFKQNQWLFNIKVLHHDYDNIRDWQTIQPCSIPCLFIRGGNSSYIKEQYYPAINSQFSNSEIVKIDHVGHNVHIEASEQVIHLIKNWLEN